MDSLLDIPKLSITSLRKLGGEWQAEQLGFGYYVYFGVIGKNHYEIQSFSQLSPKYDGDDESCRSIYRIRRNNEVDTWTYNPMWDLKNQLTQRKDAERTKK